MIAEGRRATVLELSQALQVSEATIRRDLRLLEQRGVVQRTHGGAIAPSNTGFEPTFLEKEDRAAEEKERIGRTAADLIQDGETVILDAGTTTAQIAKALRGRKGLTIITNAINIALELTHSPEIEVYLTGGTLKGSTLALVGPATEDILRGFYADKVFLGVNGVDLVRGLTTPSLSEARVKRVMLESARECILVADNSKFGEVAFAAIASLDMLDRVVSDSGLPEEFRDEFQRRKIEVLTA
jgi:DeoR family fructose operon transcriptional repressor